VFVFVFCVSMCVLCRVCLCDVLCVNLPCVSVDICFAFVW